jgi:hypothetical protein
MTSRGRPLGVFRPKNPSEVLETIEALKDEQRLVEISLLGWLQAPAGGLAAAEQRLAEARTREEETLRTILGKLPDLIVRLGRPLSKRTLSRHKAQARMRQAEVDGNQHATES